MITLERSAITGLSKSLNEPAWMLELRLRAFDVYESLPMPTTDDEPWRRTDIRGLNPTHALASSNGRVDAAHLPGYMVDELSSAEVGGHLTLVNGHVSDFHFNEELRAQGVIFMDMGRAVIEHGDLVRKWFMTEAVKSDDGKFAALHAATWRGGTFLYVPRNVTVESPLRSSLWLESGNSATHTLAVLEQGAAATLIDEYASGPGKAQVIHNGAVELLVGDSANLNYVSLQDFGPAVWQFTHERGRVGRDAELDWVYSAMGARLTKAFQNIELDGRGAWGRMSGIFFGSGRQHFDLDTQQNHNAPDTVSDLLYKGALKDRSRSVWQGLIKAQPESQRIDGFQANRNLLLSSTARADSIPGLEIEADDVRCTHAATAGQLDEGEIFYLMSRGIERRKAVEMIVEGFFAPIMERVPDDQVRERISRRIIERAADIVTA